MKLKVEALRINCGFETQEEFIDKINKELKKMKIDRQLSIKTYQNRLKNPSLWRIDECQAISTIANVPIEMIKF